MVKKGRISKILSIMLAVVMVLSSFTLVGTKASAADNLGLNVKAAILVDADSGKILYEKNAKQALGIASMTKMMTEYILLDAINDGKVKWNQKYKVSDYAYKISQDRALSNVPLRADGEYTIKELYEAMAIYSANAATIAIAETIAGSETEFLSLMKKKAKELGLKNYHFVNSTGLNNEQLQGMQPTGTSESDENKMPATSVARLAYHLLKDHPEVLETSSIPRKTFRAGTDDAIKMDNWNFMLPGLVYHYEGVDGLKTGTTDYAGQCFTGTAKRNGTRLIAVVMHAEGNNGDRHKARFDAAKTLFDYGFGQFTTEEVLPAGHVFKNQKSVAIKEGKEKSVKVATKDAISMMVKTSEADDYTAKLVVDKKSLNAPVKKGTVVGHVKINKKSGKDYGFIDGTSANAKVVTTETVEKAGFISLTFKKFGSFFKGLF